MHYIRPRPWWLIVLAYILGGGALGAALPAWKALAGNVFGRSGIANAYVINLAMPLLVASLAALYPRLWVTLLGTLAGTLTLLLCMGLMIPLAPDRWVISALAQMGPILVIACLAYHVIAAGTVAGVRLVRRVGPPPHPDACAKCGHLLTAAPSDRCPECGTPHDLSPRRSAGVAQ